MRFCLLLLLVSCASQVPKDSPSSASHKPVLVVTTDASPIPAINDVKSSEVSQVFLASDRSCAQMKDKRLLCWGRNDLGQLGDGTTTHRSSPTEIPELNKASNLALGQTHSCAVTEPGGVVCWGGNHLGQLGDGSTENRMRPVAVSNLDDIVQVAVSAGTSCALNSKGQVFCWGAAGHLSKAPDECGGGFRFYPCAKSPQRVLALNDIVSITLARGSGCALSDKAALSCWGGYAYDSSVEKIEKVADDARAVLLETERTCVMHMDGTTRCVGANYDGQLGDGSQVNRKRLVKVKNLEAASILSLGRMHTCARSTKGLVSCWGHNYGGELGDGVGGVARPNVTPVKGLGAVKALVARHHRTCAIDREDAVWCWGSLSPGFGAPTPVQMPGLENTRDIVLDTMHACALRNDATVACWGSNRFGQLGVGTISEAEAPQAILF